LIDCFFLVETWSKLKATRESCEKQIVCQSSESDKDPPKAIKTSVAYGSL